jgi:predicted nucleic acid-binding protein
MIHLDTSLLIGAEDADDAHHPMARKVLSLPGPFACSSVAWMELQSRPKPVTLRLAIKALLTSGIVAFDQNTAELAGELFHRAGSRRSTRLDTMIAATAIQAGAELATVNPDDFATFVPLGLKLLSLPA